MSSDVPAKSLTKEDEKQLWEIYTQNRDSETRTKLVEYYLDAAKKVAAKLYYHRPDDDLEFGDYLQYARLGLLDAVDRYDPGRDASFTTYATYRMRGAVLNGIEKHSEKRAQWSFQRRLHKERADSLVAEHDCSHEGRLFEEMANIAIGLAVGHLLEEPITVHEEERTEDEPYLSLEISRLREQLRMIVGSLPEREQQIVAYHYYEQMAFGEIASILGLSKGRVSQLHSRALKLIRDAYESLGSLDLSF